MALAALTAFGVAGYSVGRAYLEGWYAAAGIPVLTFSWDLQLVVLRGLSADVLPLWLLEIGTMAAMIALSGVVGWLLLKLSVWWRHRKAKPD